MATEQLPAATYAIAGQPTVTGYEVIDATFGFEEDSEDKQKGSGAHKAKITYMRRQTLQLELEELTTAANDYVKGGALTAAFVPFAPGATAVWKIRDVSKSLTRGVTGITLDLISLVDELA